VAQRFEVRWVERQVGAIGHVDLVVNVDGWFEDAAALAPDAQWIRPKVDDPQPALWITPGPPLVNHRAASL
jgi:hypothetical protein